MSKRNFSLYLPLSAFPPPMKYASTIAALLLVAVLALFGASAAPAPVAAQSSLNPPRNIIVANGDNPGEVMVNWDAVPEADVYRVGWIVFADYEAAIADGRNWLEAFVFVDVDNRGQSSHTVTRLQPGVQYYFIVGAASMRFGSAEWPPAWSPPLVVRTPPTGEPWFPRRPTPTTECYVGQRLAPGQSCLFSFHTFHQTSRYVFAVTSGGPYHGWGQLWGGEHFAFNASSVGVREPMEGVDFTFAASKRDSVFVVEQYGPDP